MKKTTTQFKRKKFTKINKTINEHHIVGLKTNIHFIPAYRYHRFVKSFTILLCVISSIVQYKLRKCKTVSWSGRINIPSTRFRSHIQCVCPKLRLNDLPCIVSEIQTFTYLYHTSSSAIAERPRCRVG